MGREVLSRTVKPVLFVLCLMPLLALALMDLGANPIEKLIHHTGEWTLRFLLVTLMVTPLQKITGIGEIARLRRMLGLYAFFYAVLHAGVYFVLDQSLDFRAVLTDVLERPYITVGFAGFLSLIPLAATSTNGMMKRLGGKRWKRLHRLAYFSAFAGTLHFLWLVKADLREPLLYLAIFTVLMLYRLWLHVIRTKVAYHRVSS